VSILLDKYYLKVYNGNVNGSSKRNVASGDEMTGLGKQAKVLSDAQLKRALEYVSTSTRYPQRNIAILNLSFRGGLRAKEIAGLTWEMVTDIDGVVGGKDQELEVRNITSKGKRGGRRIPMNSELKTSLEVLLELEKSKDRGLPTSFVVTLAKGSTEISSRAASVSFLMNGKGTQQGWYSKLGFHGATSHSGRRTFAIKSATRMSSVGGTLRDVSEMLGHSSLQMTARYLDENRDAKRKMVEKM